VRTTDLNTHSSAQVSGPCQQRDIHGVCEQNVWGIFELKESYMMKQKHANASNDQTINQNNTMRQDEQRKAFQDNQSHSVSRTAYNVTLPTDCNDDDILYNKSQKYTMTSLHGAGGSHSGLADIRCVHSMPPLLFSE